MQRREPEYPIKDANGIEMAVAWMKRMALRGLESGKPVVVRVGRERRNLEMNAKLWAMLNDVSRQVEWFGQKLSPEDWKHVFSSVCLKMRTVPGLDGGVVVLGQSTSRMTKAQFSDLIELVYSFGADRGVKWSETVPEEYRQYVG